MDYTKVDIIFGQPWFKDLGSFMLNIEKQVLTFPYKGNMITSWDMTMESKSLMSASEDFKNISDLMFKDNKKTISRKQKELEEAISHKDRSFALQRSPRKTTWASQ